MPRSLPSRNPFRVKAKCRTHTSTRRRFHFSAPCYSDGWDGAFGASWWVDPKEDLVGVLMTQRRPEDLALPAVVRDFWTSVYQAIDD